MITTERMHNITIISAIQRRNRATGTCLWRCDFSARNKGLAESTFVLFSHSRKMRDIEFGSWKGIQDSISLAIRSGEGNRTPLQYSCLENPMDRGAWKDSMESLRVRHDWATSLSLFTFTHWRRKWQPTPVFLPENPRDRGAWWAAVYGVAQSRTWLKWLSSSSNTFCSQSSRILYLVLCVFLVQRDFM